MSHSVGSQQSVVPSGLPMLPGNGFKDPTKIDFKKSHILSPAKSTHGSNIIRVKFEIRIHHMLGRWVPWNKCELSTSSATP